MNIKIHNVMKKTIILLVITFLILSLVILHNHIHIEECHDEYCIECAIIHFAQNIVQKIIITAIIFNVTIYTFFTLSKLVIIEYFYKSNSLFIQKIQLNE